MRRHLLPAALAATLAVALPASSAGPADAAGKRAEERGGKVRLAWPQAKADEAPEFPLTRWLARQVGSEPEAGAGRASAAAKAPSTLEFVGGISTGKLQLIRSFDIPAADPSAERLANLSWTYDNALAVMAFIDGDAKKQAEQLLDQLKAVQRTDGSLDFAYNVASGAGSAQVRSGTLAWVGIAATYYRRTYGSTRYDPLIAGVARSLLALRTEGGVVKGGPDASWVSTQHNLLTVAFLRDLVPSLRSKPAASSLNLSATTLDTAQGSIGSAILSGLLVQAGPYAYFIEGVGDTRVPLDVQALGAMYLKLRNDGRAAQVGAYLATSFYAPARSALGTILFGYKPFNSSAAPNIVWSEGTIQADIRCAASA